MLVLLSLKKRKKGKQFSPLGWLGWKFATSMTCGPYAGENCKCEITLYMEKLTSTESRSIKNRELRIGMNCLVGSET